MKVAVLSAGLALAGLATVPCAYASALVSSPTPVEFLFSGPSATQGTISAAGTFTIVSDTVSGDPANAYSITSIEGTFSDQAAGLSDEPIAALAAIANASPAQAGSVLDDASFSRWGGNPGASYDNLFFWNGAPIVCEGYPLSGGYVDTYGVLFALANGDNVNLWSNGDPPAANNLYGVSLWSSDAAMLDASPGTSGGDPSGVTMSVPEPGSLALLATALVIGSLAWRRSMNEPRT